MDHELWFNQIILSQSYLTGFDPTQPGFQADSKQMSDLFAKSKMKKKFAKSKMPKFALKKFFFHIKKRESKDARKALFWTA